MVARVRAVASAGDHSTASFRSRPSAMNSSSQPGGAASWDSPGAALIPTRPPSRARSRQTDSGGSLSPARSRRPPLRRAGSMNTASAPATAMSLTSAATAVTPPATP